MSRLKSLLAKMDATGRDGRDTPYNTYRARKCKTYRDGEYLLIGGIASNASTTSFSPLASSDCPDDYALAEREAIQAECSFGGSESDDVPGFDDVVPVTMAQRRAILSRVYGWVYPQEQQS